MVRGEVRHFLVAVQFLTRLPAPSYPDFDPSWLDRSAKYFPLVGAIVGLISAASLLAASAVAPQPAPVIIALAVGILVTGAFHEDGLADCADGLGGGQSRDRRLEIMKDSRIGAYGALALGMVIALKAAALSAIDPWNGALALMCAHAGGRLATVLAIRSMAYAGDPDAAKVKPLATSLSNGELSVAVALGVAPAFAMPSAESWLIGALAGSLAAATLATIARRLVGGYTGDVLGGIEQLFETAFLLGAAAVIAGPG